MKLLLDQPGILLPSNDTAQFVTVRFLQNGVEFEKIYTCLCPEEAATTHFYLDMTSYQGGEIEILVSDNETAYTRYTGGRTVWPYDVLEQQITASQPPADTEAQAAMRPKLHFTTRTGWSNDPNGCCFYQGLYHMDYQYTPGHLRPLYDNMHWGHAVSRDLIHWQECEPVLRCGSPSSGSAFVRRDTGGLYIAFQEYMAESSDGFSFRRDPELYAKKGHDPQIFYHEDSGNYVCIGIPYNEEKERWEDFRFSVSPDLKNWELTEQVAGWYECPNMAKLRIEGTDQSKWVLFGGDMAYQIGSFDGRRFTPDTIDPARRDGFLAFSERSQESEYTNKYNGQYTGNVYACQVFANIPDGRVLRSGWYFVDFAGQNMPFNQCMILLQELSLRQTAFGLRLCAEPIREIQQLRGTETQLQGGGTFHCAKGATWEFCADLSPGATLTANEFTFEHAGDQLIIRQDGVSSVQVPVPTPGKALPLRSVTDIGCFEVYADLGELYIPLCPARFAEGLSLSLAGGSDDRVSIYPLELSPKAAHPEA